MRGITFLATAAAVILAGCGSGGDGPAATVTMTNTNTVTVAAPTPSVQATNPPAQGTVPMAPVAQAPAPVVVATTWTMPNLVGSNLQAAQNEIQRITGQEIWLTTSTDLTGEGRSQIVAANWQVCSSTPPPGTAITKDTAIDFGVVRVGVEDCP